MTDKLYKELMELLLNQLKLKTSLKNFNLKKTHLLKKNRKNIARIKTLIKLKNNIKV